jgi:hypothetical protein
MARLPRIVLPGIPDYGDSLLISCSLAQTV